MERTPIEIVNFLFLPEIDGPGHLLVFTELLKKCLKVKPRDQRSLKKYIYTYIAGIF